MRGIQLPCKDSDLCEHALRGVVCEFGNGRSASCRAEDLVGLATVERRRSVAGSVVWVDKSWLVARGSWRDADRVCWCRCGCLWSGVVGCTARVCSPHSRQRAFVSSDAQNKEGEAGKWIDKRTKHLPSVTRDCWACGEGLAEGVVCVLSLRDRAKSRVGYQQVEVKGQAQGLQRATAPHTRTFLEQGSCDQQQIRARAAPAPLNLQPSGPASRTSNHPQLLSVLGQTGLN